MRVNIYYGGRGLIDDPTIFAIEKITKVLEELRVQVERYNLYEDKSNIAVFPKTLKGTDGVILAASLEWFGIGGYLQQFLDACWLYGDKDIISHLHMMPVVMATTYGEREAEMSLIRAWEMLGGIPCEGLCAYVENHVEFETNGEYNRIIEKYAENFYRSIERKSLALPNSNMQVKKTVFRGTTPLLTPQESEQLSAYVSNDNYVKKQKEDIEELTSLFKDMLADEGEDKYIKRLNKKFNPKEMIKAVFKIEIEGEEEGLVIMVNGDKLDCKRGSVADADVTAKIPAKVFDDILSGKKSFQSSFMSGKLTAQGDFKILRKFDDIFE